MGLFSSIQNFAGTALGGFTGGILGDVASAGAARKAASKNRRFQAQQASTQMDFQERMSSTAHQREIADLKAAGLNPILSGTGGAGSASPGGAMGSGSLAKTPDFANTAIAARRLNQEIKNMQAIEERTRAETRLTNLKSGSIAPVGTFGHSIVSSARGASNLWQNRQWLYPEKPASAVTFPIKMDRQQPYSKIGFKKTSKGKYKGK